MSKRRNRARRERKEWERVAQMDAANRILTFDELSNSLQKVVLSMAMAMKGYGCDEEKAIEIATQHFRSAARVAGVWDSMYAASRLVKVPK